MASNYIEIPAVGGGSGAVDSVNGLTGVVVLTKSNIGLGNVDNTSDANKPISTATQTALDAKQDEILGVDNTIVVKNSVGVVESLNNWFINDMGGLNQNLTADVNTANSPAAENKIYNANATENAPNNQFTAEYMQINVDSDNDGFDLGTNGTGIVARNTNIVHNDTSDVGSITLQTNNITLGNGTDPIDINGVAYSFGFGQINANVTISGPIQGYGFQPSMSASAIFNSSEYLQAFYDACQISTPVPFYTSFNSSPTLSEIQNNKNFTGLNVFPTITTFTGNAGFIGINVGGNLGTFNNSGYFQGVNVNPNITSSRYASGLEVSMDNVTPYAGVAASLVEQDLTFTFNSPGSFNNNYTMAYTSGGTAGSEVVSLVGNDISVQIENGVSTATQIKAAVDAIPALVDAITTTISGTASNAQNTFGPTNFSGGEDAGRVLAAYLDGDVEITGALTFGGALSIGKLNAFGSQAVITGSGNPATIHSLVSNPTVGDNETITLGDTIGVNTAMLLTVGDNSSVTSALVGLSALALPAVVNLGTGSTVDRVAGATFAISLESGAAGTITNLDLCRAVGLPNGTTTVTNLKGFAMDLPFGDPGTTTWGFYESPGVNNYFAGNLLIGGTAGSDDTVTNSSVALEVKSSTKAFLPSRMTQTQRDALTAIDGMIIYNIDVNKLQVRASSTWVDLH